MTLWLVLAASAAAVIAALYPAELSWVSARGTRWLYNRGASTYEGKWRRHDYRPYDKLVTQSALAVAGAQQPRVLDLGTGTGRALLLAIQALGARAQYTAVDFSTEMLARLQSKLESVPGDALDIALSDQDLRGWLATQSNQYDLIMCMEVGEFVADFPGVLDAAGRIARPGARLVMTRPAGLWSLFFPKRCQSRKGMAEKLAQCGFAQIEFSPWRRRYELVSCVKS